MVGHMFIFVLCRACLCGVERYVWETAGGRQAAAPELEEHAALLLPLCDHLEGVQAAVAPVAVPAAEGDQGAVESVVPGAILIHVPQAVLIGTNWNTQSACQLNQFNQLPINCQLNQSVQNLKLWIIVEHLYVFDIVMHEYNYIPPALRNGMESIWLFLCNSNSLKT